MADTAVDKKEVVSEEEVVKKVEKEVEKAEDKVEGENGSGDAASPKENGDDKKDEEATENGEPAEAAPAATKRKSVGESGDAPEAENGDAANEDGETPEKKAKLEEKVATPTKGAEDTSANGEAEAVA